MKPERTTDQVRAFLAEQIAASRSSATGFSRMLGRPDRYLGRFLNEGRPERLDDAEIAKLAAFFGVDPWELGGYIAPRCR